MVAVIFGGPSLEGVDRTQSSALFLPPAVQGDLLRAVREHRPSVIGLLDCDLPYRSLPAWHKEILFALSRGIAVVGAAAVGAHRAAELAPNGMEESAESTNVWLRANWNATTKCSATGKKHRTASGASHCRW